MWLRLLHILGLTNLTDEQVQQYEVRTTWKPLEFLFVFESESGAKIIKNGSEHRIVNIANEVLVSEFRVQQANFDLDNNRYREKILETID